VFSSNIYADGVRQHRMPQSVIHRPSAYRVRRGDSLWKIAHKYHISVDNIRKWNSLGKSKLIKPGQVLALSEQRRERRVVKKRKWVKTASLESERRTSSAGKTVKVRRGDNLWKVSRKYGLTVDQLCRWNGLKEGSILQPGQILYLSAQQ